ncbi:GNAT family N-acetyltransferase [Nocardioides korecus]
MLPPVVPAGTLGAHPQPVVRAGDLRLRPFDARDADALAAAYDDPDIRRWHVRSLTPAEAGAWVEEQHRRWAAETGAGWAVVEEGELVGRVGLRTMEPAEGEAEAAYWVLPAARGRGVATRALGAMTDWVLAQGFHRVSLRHSTLNEPSCRVALRAGFAAEGVARGSALHEDGWHDMHVHARLRTDRAG